MGNAKNLFDMCNVCQLKILNGLYYAPSQLFKMGARDSNMSVKCNAAEGTFLHLLWECKKKIKDICLKTTKEAIKNSNTRLQHKHVRYTWRFVRLQQHLIKE